MIGLQLLLNLEELPVSLDEAKKHLSVDDNADDDRILRYLNAAILSVESYTGLKLSQQYWRMACDTWEESLTVLPFGNLKV